jgi:uncharacterized protein (TIGR02646 family)
MRPIDKGASPQVFINYQDAKPFLADRLGTYCSFCERRIPTNLAVEHILPKDEDLPYAHLRNEWTNFLLSCVNCNSAKGTQIIEFDRYLLPDRDNTFPFFEYEETGQVSPRGNRRQKKMAKKTLDLVALNKYAHPDWDEDNMFSAIERFGQRVQIWVQAKEARTDFDNGEVNTRRIAAEAASSGFFSIWMTAFEGIPLVRQALIQVFANTAADCFDINTNSVSPRPANTLEQSGKV